MRWTLGCLLALTVLAPSTALAGTAEDPEVSDPAGDAGVEDRPLPAGTEDLDIVAAWFANNETGTWAHLQLVSFDVHPEDVVFSVDASLSEDRWIGVGYGSYVAPFPPFRTQGFQGCTGAGGGEPNCTQLPGEMLDDHPGFAVRIPPSWIEDEQRLRDPTARVAAYTMWPAVTFDEAGPGEVYPLENDTSDEETEDDVAASEAAGSTADGESRGVPGPGLAGAVAAASLAALAGRKASRGGA